MAETKDGGPAFPASPTRLVINSDGIPEGIDFPGMSLRDYIAIKSLCLVTQRGGHQELMLDGRGYTDPTDIAKGLYRIADAFLAARGGQQ